MKGGEGYEEEIIQEPRHDTSPPPMFIDDHDINSPPPILNHDHYLNSPPPNLTHDHDLTFPHDMSTAIQSGKSGYSTVNSARKYEKQCIVFLYIIIKLQNVM